MARRVKIGDPAQLQQQLIKLLNDFEKRLDDGDLRDQVKALVPAVYVLRDLGSSLIPEVQASSARDRILYYLKKYKFTVISGDELAVVSGISEYARRVRELRVEYGWPIYSGMTAREMLGEETEKGTADLITPQLSTSDMLSMSTDDYILVGEQDRDAAHRWNIANDIRKLDISIRDRLLQYLRSNVGKSVTGEELKYVAKGAQSWPRRTRELRTEEGWPVATRNSGRPDLPVGVYVLEADRQAAPHDRKIPDPVRVNVLERDNFKCRCCGWNPSEQKPEDPRTLLELHHIKHHAEGGSNEEDNIITLCNVHHDDVHRQKINTNSDLYQWLEENCST
ncbi:MAG: HNH endonuclease [Balneolaceae bacterium]|nr:HNH endonuclease [Balneolaceae bacterium]